ncbi:PIN domain-containing protein [bacterium]|nr:PIN domain-containing protein [candidate division CSSED10-310 bacterium]
MGVEFIDTNVLVYAHDASAGRKRKKAAELLLRLTNDGGGVLSVQVLNEFCVTVTRKVTRPLSLEDVHGIISDFSCWPVHEPVVADTLAAIGIARRYGLNFWDALIVRSAVVLGASIIWSEDLNAGQEYEEIIVRNPFME